MRWGKGGAEAPCLGAGLSGQQPQGLHGSWPALLWLPVRAAEEPEGLCCQRLQGHNPNPEGPERDRSHKKPLSPSEGGVVTISRPLLSPRPAFFL